MKLTNARALAILNPTNFKVPSMADMGRVKPGDWVQVCFNDAERLWILVTRVTTEGFIGTLDNKPQRTKGIKSGDRVVLGHENVFRIIHYDGPKRPAQIQ